MRIAVALGLTVSALLLPLPAAAAPSSISADVEALVVVAGLDDARSVAAEGINLTINLPSGPKVNQQGLVVIDGVQAACTMADTGATPCTQVTLTCGANQYVVEPGGVGVGSFDGSNVSTGSITLQCKTFPTPPTARH